MRWRDRLVVCRRFWIWFILTYLSGVLCFSIEGQAPLLSAISSQVAREELSPFFEVEQLFSGSIGIGRDWNQLQHRGYGLEESCNGKSQGQDNKSGVGIFAISEKYYESFYLFQEQAQPKHEIRYRYLAIGVIGFLGYIAGLVFILMGLVGFKRTVLLGIVLVVVGWLCGQFGFYYGFKCVLSSVLEHWDFQSATTFLLPFVSSSRAGEGGGW